MFEFAVQLAADHRGPSAGAVCRGALREDTGTGAIAGQPSLRRAGRAGKPHKGKWSDYTVGHRDHSLGNAATHQGTNRGGRIGHLMQCRGGGLDKVHYRNFDNDCLTGYLVRIPVSGLLVVFAGARRSGHRRCASPGPPAPRPGRKPRRERRSGPPASACRARAAERRAPCRVDRRAESASARRRGHAGRAR